MPHQIETEQKAHIMLRYFSVENYYSLKDKAEIDFRLTKRDSPQGWSIPSPNKDRLSTAIGILGANGSGKTFLLRAMAFASWFIRQSFFRNAELDIPFAPWFNSLDPTKFEIHFEDKEGHVFFYHLHLMPERVIEERLSSKEKLNNKKENIIFARVWDHEKQSYHFERPDNTFAGLREEQFRHNASVISTAKQFNISLPLFQLAGEITNIGPFGRLHDDFFIPRSISLYKNNEKLQEAVNNFLKKADFGLNGIKIEEVQETDPQTGKEKEGYKIWGLHQLEGEKDPHSVSFHLESAGTRTVFALLPMFFLALEKGNIVFIDELEANLHPALVSAILELFDNPNTNPKGAQIVFSSHMPELIDFLGKSHIYLAEKNNQKSEIYPLSDFDEARTDQKLAPLYLTGKFGGVPLIGGPTV